MKERASKYWICNLCAKKQGLDKGVELIGVTAIRGLCGHCKREDEAYLIPVIDYEKPGWD
jgi:hypothetical protein